MSRVYLSIAVLLLAVVLLSPSGTTAAPPVPLGHGTSIEPQLLKELAAEGKATFLVYLKEQPLPELSVATIARTDKLERRQAVFQSLRDVAERSQTDLRAFLTKAQLAGRASDITPLWIINAVAVTGDETLLRALARRPDVARIMSNHVYRLEPPLRQAAPDAVGGTTWNVQRLRADQVWADFGIDGNGVVVATIDTGVEWTHPALLHAYRGGPQGNHNYNWFDATGESPDVPVDPHSHGTHTMGIIVGQDTSCSGELPCPFTIGIAPGARWIAVRVFDASGYTSDLELHRGFQWILAPTDLNGENPDPSKAPDVVNSSWGATNIAKPNFRPDVRALRAAGILPVFSAGNAGERGVGTVGTPAAFPESFAVGAVDPNDLVTDFSSRGPSFWGETKPEVVAPGAYVRSSVPGGYDDYSGTSMAAPHAVGLAALLLQADPSLSPDDLEQLMMRSAVDLGTPGSDNSYGAGRLNAYAAVYWASKAGRLSGVVRSAAGDLLAGATVSGVSQSDPTLRFTATADEDGAYRVAIPAGSYTMTAQAFAFQPQTQTNVAVFADFESVRDFRLLPQPTLELSGRVTEAGSNEPLEATIRAENAPVSARTDRDGRYQLALPAGVYTITASATGHQSISLMATLVTEGVSATLDFALPVAPSLLLVEGDAWLEDNTVPYWDRALRSAGYSYDVHLLDQPEEDVYDIPTPEQLASYDIVLWANPWSSPGYIDRLTGGITTTSLLTNFLDSGGRLLIAGRDVGYWDGGGDPYGPGELSYYRNYLHARYRRDDAGSERLLGVEGDILAGRQIELNAPLTYRRSQEYPDEIAPADAAAAPILTYDVDARVGGLRAAANSYRVVYWAFGLENAGPPEELAAALDASLRWLAQPSLALTVNKPEVEPGELLTYTLALHNPLYSPRLGLSLRDPLPDELTFVNADEGLVFNRDTRTVAWHGDLLGRETLSLGFRAQVNTPLAGGTVITNTAVLSDGTIGRIQTHAVSIVRGPDLRPSQKSVIPSITVPGDLVTFTLSAENAGSRAATGVVLTDPLPTSLTYVTGSVIGGSYNAVENQIEWRGDLPAAEPGDVNYTWIDSDQPGGPEFAWMDISTDGTPISLGDDAWSGPFPIGFDFPFFGQRFSEFYLSSNGWMSFEQPTSSDPSNEELPSESAPANLIAIFWDDLNPGTGGQVLYRAEAGRLIVSFLGVPRYGSGGPYTFQAILTPDGLIRLQYREMQGTRLDEATIGLQDGTRTQGLTIAYNQDYVHDLLSVLVRPPRPPSTGQHVITFQARVNDGVPENTRIENVMWVGDGGGLRYARQATLHVLPADLSGSHLSPEAAMAQPGDRVDYTLRISNSGLGGASVSLLNPLPEELLYVQGSVTGGAVYDEAIRAIVWDGRLSTGTIVTVTYAVTVALDTPPGTLLRNQATLVDNAGQIVTRTATLQVERVDLSESLKQVTPGAAASGDVVTYTIRLINTGGITATNVSLTDPLASALTLLTETLSAGATYDPAQHQIEWSGRVPPRVPNYTWRTSDDPGGPAFHWVDITDRGTPVAMGDDTVRGPLDVGFPFPFFGENQSQFWLSSNGWISFGRPESSDFSNELLPSETAPPGVLAIFWDDLNPSLGGEVRYWSNEHDTLVVSFLEVPRYGGGGPYSFQAILRADGSITYQYLDMNDPLNSATVGLQNLEGDQGVTASYNNASFFHNELTVQFHPPGGEQAVRFAARVAEELPYRSEVLNTAIVDDGHGRQHRLQTPLLVNTVDLVGTFVASEHEALPGEMVDYVLRLRNLGNATAQPVSVEIPIPPGTTYREGSGWGGVVYVTTTKTITWTGAIPAGDEIILGFGVQLDLSLEDGTLVRAGVSVDDGTGVVWWFEDTTRVHAPDLSSTSLQPSAPQVELGETIVLSLTLVNQGTASASVALGLALPANVSYVPGSAWAGSGQPFIYRPEAHSLGWGGKIPAAGIVWLRCAIRPTASGPLSLEALIVDQYGTVTRPTATVEVRGIVLSLPLVTGSPRGTALP
ncbi:MAG TPA: DUF11 domain-containing protein [Anaerolineae bacterium]|nr:DUF11 domain-containing protein [Anaerolineae bacterium]